MCFTNVRTSYILISLSHYLKAQYFFSWDSICDAIFIATWQSFFGPQKFTVTCLCHLIFNVCRDREKCIFLEIINQCLPDEVNVTPLTKTEGFYDSLKLLRTEVQTLET